MVETERKRLAGDWSAISAVDRDLAAIKLASATPSTRTTTTLLELNGVGPIVAALILAHVGDPAPLRDPGDGSASYNGTAPIEASSGPRRNGTGSTRAGTANSTTPCISSP